MIQQALALMLQRLLGKFITLDSTQLNMSLWDGDLKFKNLQLKLGYGQGIVGELQVQIPWRSLWSQPVVIRAKNIRIYAHANSDHSETIEILDNRDTSEEQDKTYLSKLLSCIISNVQIELEDIKIQYDCIDELQHEYGYAQFEIKRIQLENTNGEWISTFIDPSLGGNISRKRIQANGISTSVAMYPYSKSPSYLFHNLTVDTKVTLSYQSSSAAIPDVELSIEFLPNSSPILCDACNVAGQDISRGLNVHFESTHIDVFTSILKELRLPFDQFDQLSKSAPNKNEGFAQVLLYAKQWLLADCIDGTTNGSHLLSDDEDDDVFEDAVAPPSLTILVAIKSEIHLTLFPRNPIPVQFWLLGIDHVELMWRQTCVESEFHLDIDHVYLIEHDTEMVKKYIVQEGTSGINFLHLKCTLPEEESRLVGAHAHINLDMKNIMIVSISETTLAEWLAIFHPLLSWYENWNQQYPAIVSTSTTFLQAIIDVNVAGFEIDFVLDSTLSFGLYLHTLDFDTSTGDDTTTTTFSLKDLRFFSNVHTIFTIENVSSRLTSPSTNGIMNETTYRCSHTFGNGPSMPTLNKNHSFSDRFTTEINNEIAMSHFYFDSPVISLNLNEKELNSLMTLTSKYTKYMTKSTTRDGSIRPIHHSSCILSMKIKIPEINIHFKPFLKLKIKLFNFELLKCTNIVHSIIKMESLVVLDLINEIVEALTLENGLVLEIATCPRSSYTMSETMNQNANQVNLLHVDIPGRVKCNLSTIFIRHISRWQNIASLHAGMIFKGNDGEINKETIKPILFPREAARCSWETRIWMEHGFLVDIYHDDDDSFHRKQCKTCNDSRLHLVSVSSSFTSITDCGYDPSCEITRDIRGTFKTVQLHDHTHPFHGADTRMVHSTIIAGTREDNSQHVDFRMVSSQTDTKSETCLQIRLEGVAISYLYRVHKQLDYYIRYHLYDAIFNCLSTEEIESICSEYQQRESVEGDDTKMDFSWEMVAHDLSFCLPRNSFTSEAIVLRCASAKFQSGTESSEFLTNGLFPDEEVGHTSVETLTRRQELRRAELRHWRRILKNQRAKLLVSQAQLHADLKSATRESHRSMHEGGSVDSLLHAEQACSILTTKLESLEVYLSTINDHLEFINTEIEATKYSDDDTRVTGRYRSHSLDVIQESVSNIPEFSVGSLFGAEDAAFHDATDEMTSDPVQSWLTIELIGLSGWSIDSDTNAIDLEHPMFLQAMALCHVNFKELIDEKSSLSYWMQEIDIELNEWSIDLLEYQYGILVGMMYENMKEGNTIVNEWRWLQCDECGGFHESNVPCNVTWFELNFNVLDATMNLHKRISMPKRNMSLDFEQFHFSVIMKTDDSLGMDVSIVSMNLNQETECIKEFTRPTQSIRDVPQFEIESIANYTDSKYIIRLNHSHIMMLTDSLNMLKTFFSWPFWQNGIKSQLSFIALPPIDWKLMEVSVIFDKECCFYFLEDFNSLNSRAIVFISQLKFDYTWTQDILKSISSTKTDLTIEQRGVYITTLPELKIEMDFPLMNPFSFQYMHLMEYIHQPNYNATQRYAISLHGDQEDMSIIPVEIRISVEDYFLLTNIIQMYLNHISTSNCGIEINEIYPIPIIIGDRLLGDIGGIRIVLLNNSLGIPIVDFILSEIVFEYENLNESNLSIGGIIHFNYFNNSIYRWEPLIEPFEIQTFSKIKNSFEIEMNFPFTLNINLTPAIAPILFLDSALYLRNIKLTTPFWLKNSLGTSIRYSFAHGEIFLQDNVQDGQMVPIDCRDKSSHLRTFDKSSELEMLNRNNLTAHHSLFLWIESINMKYMSVNPVNVDVVGYVSICLKPVDDSILLQEITMPVIVAEISLQEDGSKLIHIHSQVLLRNDTTIPVIVWGYAPPGMIEEWIVDRETTSYVPLHLLHPQGRLSVRPSLNTDYAPLGCTFQRFEQDIQKSEINFKDQRRRFIRCGNCICKSKLNNNKNSSIFTMQLLPGMIVNELPPWQCIYDIEAFSLINTTISTPYQRESIQDENIIEIDENNIFTNLLFDDENNKKNIIIDDILQDAKHAKQNQEISKIYYAHIITLKPIMTLHNRLACPVAYRILEKSLQLIAEGILIVGDILPLFQLNDELYISYRLENYNWSEPMTLIDPKTIPLPFRETIDTIRLNGRKFNDIKKYKNTQGPVPEIQLKLKKKERDVFIYCNLWIVNHTGLPLEYCDSISKKSLDNASTYMHNLPGSLACTNFIGRRKSKSIVSPIPVPDDFHFFEKSASIVPIGLYFVTTSAENLYNSHKYLGTQNPYVHVSLWIPKQNKNGMFVDTMYCYGTTKPHFGGGINPIFKNIHKNTLYLPFPIEHGKYQLQQARIKIEIRNAWYTSDSLLGSVVFLLSEISGNREKYAQLTFYDLVRKSSQKKTQEFAGKIQASITIATKHLLESNSDSSWGMVLTTPRQQRVNAATVQNDTSFELTVYLPSNRFNSIGITVTPTTTLSDIVMKISDLGGYVMDPAEYILVELLLPRFVALRSAGRPEAERWYGLVVVDRNAPIHTIGKKYGVHLCHRISFNTLRLYDESSTASVHHSTPRSLAQHRQPVQTRPVEWSEAINFGSKTGSYWDVLRVRAFNSSWSEPLRLHRNAMGNSGVAQLLTLVEENEEGRLNPSKQYELALWSCYGPGAYGDTIITTIVPRYVLINQTSQSLWYRQSNCQIITNLSVNDMKSFHWDKADEPKKNIQVTFADSDMDWSGPFTIHSLGTTHLKLRGKKNVHEISILQAQLEMVGGSIVCVFRDESKRWPPYRIDNFTSFRLQFHQVQWNKEIWDEVRPRSSVPYCWDHHEGKQTISPDGSQTHVLERYLDIRFMQVSSSLSMDITNAVVDTKEYNLDIMQKHKRIQLTRSLPAALFDCNCIHGVLLKKDNAINWSKRYFRLHQHILYYFLNENEHGLRGVIDLGRNPFGEQVTLYMKGWSKEKYKKKNISKHGYNFDNLTKHISGTLFGDENNNLFNIYSEEYALWIGTLIRMSYDMIEKAKEWLNALTLNSTDLSPSQLFLVSGIDFVIFLRNENIVSSDNHAIDMAQQLLYYGVLTLWNPPPDMDVENILFENSTILYRIQYPTPPAPTCREFTIYTPGKTYFLRAETPESAAIWCRHIREAMIHAMHDIHSSKDLKTSNILNDIKTTTKTYVYARVRADGPTKVLELTEGGEEDDEIGCVLDPIEIIDDNLNDDIKNKWMKNIIVKINISNFGISFINEKPMEFIYANINGLDLLFHRNLNKMLFGITWKNIQADNQVPEATFQTLLYSKQIEMIDLNNCIDCGLPLKLNVFHFCCRWSNEQGSTDYFEYCSLYISPMSLQLDEELVSLFRRFINEAFLQHGGLHGQDLMETMQCTHVMNIQQVHDDYKIGVESDELNPLLNTSLLKNHIGIITERKIYFAILRVYPVEIDITFRSDVIGDRFKTNENDELNNEKVAAWIPSLSMHVPDLDNAPIRLNSLIVEHAFGTSTEVTRRVSKYYTRQLWKQVHKVLGSFDFLGNPAGLLDHLGTAVRDLIVEPIEGARAGSGITGSGVGFGKGLAKGATSFVNNFIDGTSDATSKVTGTFGQGLATMSFDDHYQQVRARARRRHVHGFKEGIIQGSKELSLGMMEGVTGIVMNPLRGAQTNGAVGFLKGTLTGIIGLPMKPVAGVFDFASRATQGIRNRSIYHGRTSLRLPRVFGRYNELKSYKEEDVIAHMLVRKTGTDEKIIFHCRIEQMVPASEIADAARARQLMIPLHRQVLKMDRYETDEEENERGKRASYCVVFSKKSLGLELETDFYGEAVIIKKCIDPSAIHGAETTNRELTSKLLQSGDILVKIGDVNIKNIGFRETIALIKGSTRPITLTFESCDIFDEESSTNDLKYIYSPRSTSMISTIVSNTCLKVKQMHWIIITDKRVLYIEWNEDGSLDHAILEWSAPLNCIHSVDYNDDSILLHLRVGVNSIFTGPLLRPEWKHETNQSIESMKIFYRVMQKNFGLKSDLSDIQEVYPSDTSFCGIIKIMLSSSGNKRRRWCVLSRNCLYIFTINTPKILRFIIPLGRIGVFKDNNASIHLNNTISGELISYLQVDGPNLTEKMDYEIILLTEDIEMWLSALQHAAGKGMRHSKGTRFYAPSEATTLSIGRKETKRYMVVQLVDALQKTLTVFKT